MPTKKTVRNNARWQAVKALASARHAVKLLERITDDAHPSVCTDSARKAQNVLQRAATNAMLAGSEFGLFEMM
jgi:hypothetical protein